MSEDSFLGNVISTGFLSETKKSYNELLRRECLGLKEAAYTHQDGTQVILAEGSRQRYRDYPGMDFIFVKGPKFIHIATNEKDEKKDLTVAIGNFSLSNKSMVQRVVYSIDDEHSVKEVRDTLEKELPALKNVFDKYVPDDSMRGMIDKLMSSNESNNASNLFMTALNDWKSYHNI